MHKFIKLFLIVVATAFIAGIYGILHDQITFSLSEEYFTKFKFYQFQLAPELHNRLGVCIVGFLSTWWVGAIAGLILIFIGFIHNNEQARVRLISKSIVTALIFSIFASLILDAYLLVNEYYFNPFGYQQYVFDLPANVPGNIVIYNSFNFYLVGMIHFYSYLGGIPGLFAGIIYQVIKFIKNRKPDFSANIS